MRAVTAGVLIGVLAGGIVVGPNGVSRAQPDPDMERAKGLYKTAEAQMAAGKFAEAIANYGAVYDITRDPVLFYKIGTANEKAGRCDVALTYYGRYLREAKPAEQFVAVTQEHIATCGGDPHVIGVVDPTGPHGPGSTEGSAVTAGSADVVAAPLAVPAAPITPVAKPATPTPIGQHQGAWLLVSGSLAFATIGAVLAYSASAAENDVADLYVGLGNQPPVFDPRTQKTYEALLADGRRYEVLSWVSLGLAGVAAAGAAVLFLHDSGPEHADQSLRITPIVHRDGGGVAATVRF